MRDLETDILDDYESSILERIRPSMTRDAIRRVSCAAAT